MVQPSIPDIDSALVQPRPNVFQAVAGGGPVFDFWPRLTDLAHVFSGFFPHSYGEADEVDFALEIVVPGSLSVGRQIGSL
jgi:hypothetical protein